MTARLRGLFSSCSLAALAACASPARGLPRPEPQYFPILPFGGPLVLQAGGQAGFGDVGTVDGFEFGLGSELCPELDLLWRVVNGDLAASEPLLGGSVEPDGSQLFLDLMLLGHVPLRDRLNLYLSGFLGYGFFDPDHSQQDTADGRSWGLGTGVEFVPERHFALSAGVEYRNTSWQSVLDPDFGQNDLRFMIGVTVRFP